MRAGNIAPFLLSFGVFLTGYLGIAISMWPYLVPFEITFRKAAAAPESQSLLLDRHGHHVAAGSCLYTGYCYYIFRGKASHESALLKNSGSGCGLRHSAAVDSFPFFSWPI